MAVTLTAPVEGLNRGDTYSGKNEEFLVANGYAYRSDGKQVAGQAENDLMLAENREAPGEAPPVRKGIITVEDHPDEYVEPEVDPLSSEQPLQKLIDQKWKGVEDGTRDPNNPDVVLEDAQKAIQESIDYDGNAVEDIVKRQDRATTAFTKRFEAEREAEGKRAQAEYEKWLSDQQVDGTKEVPAERNRFAETGGEKGDAKLEGDTAARDNAKAKVTQGITGRNGVTIGGDPLILPEKKAEPKKD